MNFDPRLVQRLTRPLKRPGVTNHRMAEGLIERFQALENRLPLLDQQLSRWATTVEFDGGEVPIVYAQVSELDDQEVNNFQESLVAVKKEVRSPVQNSPAQNTVKSPEIPVVQQEISASPITSVEEASVAAIAPQNEQPLTQISDHPQISSIPTVQLVSNTQPEISQPLIIQPVSESVIQARHDNATPSVINAAPLISMVSDAPTDPLALEEIATPISTEFNSTPDARPLVEQEIASTPIASVEASVRAVKAIATQTEQPLTQISDRPQISSIPTVQIVPNTQPEISQPLIIQPVSEGVIQARYDNAAPSIINSEPVISTVNDAPTYPLALDEIATPITTEVDSALDAMHLVQQEISPTPIASIEASVRAVKAIASSEQKLSFVQLPQNSGATPIDQGLLISSESLPKTSILPIDLPTETTQNEQPVTQISDRPQIPTIPISNPPSTLSSDSLSFATNIPSEPSEHQLSPLQVQQINTVNTKHLDYPQTTVQVVSDAQPEVPQPLIIQPVSEGVIQARYDNAAPSMINGESLISTKVSDAPTYPLALDAIATPIPNEVDSALESMPLVQQEISSTPIGLVEASVTAVKAIASETTPVNINAAINPANEPVIQAKEDLTIKTRSLIEGVSEPINFTSAIASSEQTLSFVQLPENSDSTPMAQGLPMPSDISLPKTSILPIDLPTESPQNKQILTQISDRPQIPSIPTTVEIVSNTQPEISQPLLIQPVSEGVIQARYDSAAPSMINAQPLISTVSDAPIYSLPMETAITPIENVLNRDSTTPDASITKLPLLDSLPEVVEIPWTSSEDPQNPMPMVNATPITLSRPSIVANIPSLENSTFESPTPIKVRKIDAPTAHILPDSLDTQTIHSSQDRLVFTPSNPTPVNENKVVATPIINPKTKKFTDSALSNDPQNQVNFSPVRTQIVREKVSTSNYWPPLSMEAMEDFQNSQPILTSVNNNSGKSPPPQSPVLPTVQAIAEISEQIFEPLLLSRRSSNASASEIRENHPNQGQPNSRAIANSSNMITYSTSNSSTETNISSQLSPSQLSPSQSSTVTNRSNQDPNNSMRPQNIPEVKEANINMDLLVAQIERKIMKRLVVEGERRGKRKWL